jgi:hypothetical protein
MSLVASSNDLSTLFQQPSGSDIANSLFVGINSPNGQFGIVQWPANPVGRGDVPVTWNVGDFTGFYPTDLASSQRGVSSTYGTTAVQEEAGTIGILIDSNSLKTAKMGSGTLLPVLAQENFTPANQPVPFADPTKALVYSLDAQIPTAQADNVTAFAYATMYFDFHDTASGLNFWLGAQVFDSRGASMAHEMVNYDGSTHQAIVASVVGIDGHYATAVAGSSGFQSTPWTGYKHFDFAVTATDMSNAIASVKARFPQQYAALSSDPSHFTISEFNFNPEIAYYGGAGEIGVSFKNINIQLEDAQPPPNVTVPDQLVFKQALNAPAVTVGHLSPHEELALSHAIFTRLAGDADGHLLQRMFHVGPTFTSPVQRIDYNPTNGWLTYNPARHHAGGYPFNPVITRGTDANHPGAHAWHFATLPKHQHLHCHDFLVVA